jgi:lactate dehydrogenase-like 2-hydroxyacid dehydrogenase
MARVFVTRELPGPALDRLRALHETVVWPERLPPPYEVLREQSAAADGVLTLLTDRVDAALIEAAPRLVAISNYAVGVDNVDLAAAARRGIPVGHTPEVLTEATADLAFALLLAAARRLPEAIEVARRDWLTWEPGALLGAEVHGATLGIIGYGRIGRAVARRAAGFDMTVLTTSSGSARGAELDGLLRESDFVSIHCPLTLATHHLIDREALARMKPTAILLNTARGPIVDSAAVADALHAGQLAGAALDVTDPEPLPPDHSLWSAPNLLVVPHIGSATHATRERMTEIAVENLLAALDGRPMPFQVNRS